MSNNNLMNRRAFLKIVAAGGTAALAWSLGIRPAENRQVASETRILMGTVVNLTVVGDDRDAIQNALYACLDHMQFLEGVLSRFRPQSQLSVLNRTGRLDTADPHLLFVLRQAREISTLSGGAFDITVKPVVDLFQEYHAAHDSLPPGSMISERLSLVDFSQVWISGESIGLGIPGMAITLDGIAKGYIVDEGIAVLRNYGLQNVMVEAGGDLMALGRNSEDLPWRIGLQAPRPDHQDVTTVFNITNRALATSGDYMQAFTADYSEFHILDPRTGRSPVQLASVSVIAPSAARADALATAVMVMGVEKGLQLMQSLPGHEAYLVSKDMQVFRTRGT